MTFLLLLPAILSLLVLAAHFLHAGQLSLTLICLLLNFLLFIKQKWIPRLMQLILILAALEWVRTTIILANQRIQADQPWARMAVILCIVTAFNLIAAILFQTPRLQIHYHRK